MCNTKDEWVYRDLGSKNGTYLNGEKIGGGRIGRKAKDSGQLSAEYHLDYGDVLRVGLTEMTLLPISIEEKNNKNNLVLKSSKFTRSQKITLHWS